MTKRDLVIRIAEETGLTQNDVAYVVQKTLDYVADELSAGKNIELRNFGVFEVKIRKSRKGRNPNKPKNEVIIPERAVVRFRPGKDLKDRVEQLKPATLKRRKKK
jgi:nucleoid DNA-binding protein